METASHQMRETFNEVYHAIKNYCEWVMGNIMILEIHDKLINEKSDNEFMEGIPKMNLTMKL